MSLPTITGTISTDPLHGAFLSEEVERELQQLLQASDDFIKRTKEAPECKPSYVETCLDSVNRALRDKHQLTLAGNVFYTLNAKGLPDESRSVTGEKSPLTVLKRISK